MRDILEIAERVLRKYPLCDRCLGRLFANLGKGLTNDVRGRSLKTVLLMNIMYRDSSDRERLLEELRSLALNAGEPFTTTIERLFGESIARKKCYVCDDSIESIINEYSERVASVLEKSGASRFLLGVRVPRTLLEREESIARELGIDSWESVKSELKREIGKRVRDRGFKPDFEDPEIVLTIDLNTSSIVTTRPSIFYVLRVRKKERGYRIRGSKNSLESLLSERLSILSPDYVKLYPTTRDSYRYRILENGVIAVLEIHSPKRGRVDLRELEKILKDLNPFEIEIISRGFRRDIHELNNRLSKTVYRTLVESEREIDLSRASSIMNSETILVTQSTPTRFLLKGALDKTRRGVVSIRDLKRQEENRYVIVIVADKRLFVEEFIEGDNGRTSPSLSDLLGERLRVLEVNIIGQA
ncbi:MAG: tRNA pseudouridine(54/55) synthase Pus10 [Sulfolobales archaeon]